MNFDLFSAVVGGVIIWLLGWVGKHFLDRLILPRFLDWWAARNARRAAKRAKRVLALYQNEVIELYDVRYFLLRAVCTIIMAVYAVGGLIFILVGEGIDEILLGVSRDFAIFTRFFRIFVASTLSSPPATGRWNGLFAWDEGCGGKHAGKINAQG
jgi:hypothetical protein